MFNKIMIICVGNICRSPMAEALLKQKLLSISPTTHISSAGLDALIGHQAHTIVQDLLAERGIDISHHRAKQIDKSMLINSDLILTMETRHQQDIEYTLPNIKGRVYRIGTWGNFDVPDPYGLPRRAFEESLSLIENSIDFWLRNLFTK